MSAIPLEEIFSSYPDIKQECDELQKNYSTELSYFWDEANTGGWIEYSVMGVSIGAGIATSGFIQSYFSKAGESAWQATTNLFKHVAKKYNRKKMFFYATVKAKNSRVVVLLDDKLLKSEDLTNQALILLQKMLRLIEEDNEFVTYYCPGTCIIKYDSRCAEFLICPFGNNFDLEHSLQQPWLLDKPVEDLADLFRYQAMFYRSLSEFEESAKYFEKAITSNPKKPDTYFQMGNMYFYWKKYSKAIEYWKKTVDIAPADYVDISTAYLNIACATSKMGNMEAAATMLEKAIEAGITPSDVELEPDLAEFRQDSRYKDIQEKLRIAVKKSESGSTLTDPFIESFLKNIWAEAWPTKVSEFDPDIELMLSFAYSLFGYADGSHAPKGVLMGPGLEKMKVSLLKVIDPMLSANERHLINIPIEFARVPYVDATHLFDHTTGKRWIVLNINLFGALYAANDRFNELLSAGQGDTVGTLSEEDLLAIAFKFPNLISRFFLGSKGEMDSWMFRLETRLNAGIRSIVWANTCIQQVFLILHEMGHAFYGHGKASAIAIGSNVASWHPSSKEYSLESEADLFAATHMSKGPWPELLAQPRSLLITSMFQFFECLELLRKMGRYAQDSHMLPRDRFHKAAMVIDHNTYLAHKASFDYYQSLLDDVYTAWKLNSEEQGALQ